MKASVSFRPDFIIPAPDPAAGAEMYKWACDIFPICRSVTGAGVRDTLGYFRTVLPDTPIQIHEVPSGTRCFDWVVPDEWAIRDAYVTGPDGTRVIDFKENNLHVVGYSVPVDTDLELEELEAHLHSLPEQPDAIPYVTSYYTRRWGFCLAHRRRLALKKGRYRVKIDSTLSPGSLTYAELLIPGNEKKEILLSTYICHPSLANDNVSGPVLALALARWIAAQKNRRFSYRIVFVPETIGAIAYLSRNRDAMHGNTVAGFVLTCCGDDRGYSYMASPEADTVADRAARNILKYHTDGYQSYDFVDRGSDERQYCSPGVDLPVVSIMRSRYDCYPEYHTSLDDLSLISPAGLGGAYSIMQRVLTAVEHNYRFRLDTVCEPQLGQRGLYPTQNTKTYAHSIRDIVNFGAYANGKRDLIEIADRIGLSVMDCLPLAKALYDSQVVSVADGE